ncbi:polysaccharide biosynthesis C-terminal domain-containing protein [Ascidiimonas aurantiaca]|uniref:polysaccharide biosynthesis C-terminal domain-containing protein n=1 Tax=Ascidiimonas aurantiaca TaxID=1685432 RepID=UPI0030EBE30B
MSLGKNTFFLSISNLSVTLSNLVLSVGLAWILLEKEDYGKLHQVFMIASFALSFLSGFPTGLSYFYGIYKSNRKKDKLLFKRFFYSMLFLAAFICLIFYLLKADIANSFINDLISEYFFLCVGIIFFRSTSGFFINYFTLTDKTGRLFVINFFYLLVSLLFILALYLKPIWGSTVFILKSILFIDMIRFLFFYYSINKYVVLKGAFLITKKELFYILPITGVTLLNTLYVFVDKYMISVMLNPEAYAEYQVGAFVIPFVNIITGSIMVTLLPIFSKLSSNQQYLEIIKKLRDSTKKTTLLLIPIFCYCLVFGKQLIISIYSEKYVFSGEIFTIYTLRFFTTVILFSLTMAAIGLQNWVVITAGLSLSVNVVLNYFLIKLYGVMGAVYATVLTGYLGIFLPIYLINKKLKTSFLEYFPLKEYFFTLTISLILSFFIYFVFFKVLLLSNEWSILLSIFYYIVVLYFCNKVLRIFGIDKLKKLTKEKLGM